jgi:hypothetical protein
MGLELLRLTPGVIDLLRRIVAKMLGHNLTEKERNETFLGLRSLDDPSEFYFGRELGQKTILIQMVMFVYVCMSPITSYFTLFVFTALVIGFRNQFIYIYPIANDSGGKLWISFTKISIVCMIVAELILFAVILLKGALIPAFLLLPLIAASIMFDAYFKKRHFTITKFLPVGECALVDSQNEGDESLKELLKGSYLQPALKKGRKEFLRTTIQQVERVRKFLHQWTMPSSSEELVSRAVVVVERLSTMTFFTKQLTKKTRAVPAVREREMLVGIA